MARKRPSGGQGGSLEDSLASPPQGVIETEGAKRTRKVVKDDL